ncbi:response regulator transcription factor [Nocardia sp. CDC159]|uniref:Response regulator transcription factor n=1 Tax=Nocardia pulmonis TaxID=2951408 RepID=A0A9X2E7V3_9NOCA|nr:MULTISPECIES: response regulator transcription factor [Nocardia]MCM6774813.1 response regulator transcription factor [Nocardia pulmonis]MCM6789744.1 response regulator transcription factor [Nocardia sp. CDC159]
MTTTTSARPLLRVVSSLVLAIAALALSMGSAVAETPARQEAGLGTAVRPAPISVLLANDHIVFRSGLRSVLATQPDIRCVGEVGDGPAAIREMGRLRPDVAILDLDMPGLDDPALVRTVAALGESTRILALTAHDTEENLYRAMRLGASGFLVKSLPSQDLIAAVRTAARGDALIDPRRTRLLIERLTRGSEPFPSAPEVDTLTAREYEVLLLIAKAHTNPEIARVLGVGEQTVKTHVSNVLAKLGVRDRVHAAVYAHTRRIVPLEATDYPLPPR